MSRIRLKLFLALHLALMLPAQVFAQVPTPKTEPIIGGTLGSASLYPAVVQILVGAGICTGTLIDPNFVLTAGHCAFDERGRVIHNLDDVSVFFSNEVRGVKAVHVHPDYDNRAAPCSEGIPDASLFELNSPIHTITPITVADTPPSIGTQLLLVGYGILGNGFSGENGSFPTSGSLAYGNTYIDRLDSTYIIWKYKSSRGGANTAGGDSGGPAFQTVDNQLILRGITCGGTGNAEYGTESFDTRADVLVDWLRKFTQLTSSTSPPSIAVPSTLSTRAQRSFHFTPVFGGVQPITSRVDGLPAGLVYENGVIHGIAAVPGIYPLTIKAENLNGARSVTTTLVVKKPDTIFKITRATLQFDNTVFPRDLLTISGRLKVRVARLARNRHLQIQFGNYIRSFTISFKRHRVNSGGDSLTVESISYNRARDFLTLNFKAAISNATAFSEISLLGFPQTGAATFGEVKSLPITFQFDGNRATIDQALSLGSADLRWHLVK